MMLMLMMMMMMMMMLMMMMMMMICKPYPIHDMHDDYVPVSNIYAAWDGYQSKY